MWLQQTDYLGLLQMGKGRKHIVAFVVSVPRQKSMGVQLVAKGKCN